MQVVKGRSVIIQLHKPPWEDRDLADNGHIFCWQEENMLWQRRVQIDKLIGLFLCSKSKLGQQYPGRLSE